MKLSYREVHRRKCKICASKFLVQIDLERYLCRFTYEQIIRGYPSLKLNGANLSVHFKNTSEETKRFWKWIKKSKPENGYELIQEHYFPRRKPSNFPSFEEAFYVD